MTTSQPIIGSAAGREPAADGGGPSGMAARPLVALLLLVAAPACRPPGPGAGPSRQLVAATAIVLQAPGGPPELCLGGIRLSLPLRCGDVPVRGWRWDAVRGERRRAGTIWGSYRVVGTYDGAAFTVERARPGRPGGGDDGWRPPPPCDAAGAAGGGAGDAERGAVARAAAADPGFAGLWVGGRRRLTVAFTGDPERRRARLARVWPGPLCLVARGRTLARLERIQADLTPARLRTMGLHMLGTAVDVVANQVALDVVAADAAARRTLADRYGAGAVRVTAALRPLP